VCTMRTVSKDILTVLICLFIACACMHPYVYCTPCVHLMRRRIHVCHMRRRIHVCHMRRRIHVCHMRRRIHVCTEHAMCTPYEEDTCVI
jgi:hypothetical protein